MLTAEPDIRAVERLCHSVVLVARSERVCAESRRLVGWSQRLMDRARRPIGGGADRAAEQRTIVARLQRLVADGTLPERPSGVWAGRSRGGRQCTGCETGIEAGEIEYEIGACVLHRRCYELWRSADGEWDMLAQ